MISKYNKKREQGFTIIEVLIVLAIAGLILLIVFLAVPALQRNARNTSRKDDAAGALSGINEWINNNGGSTAITSCPDLVSGNGSSIVWTGASGTTTSQTNFGYYSKGCNFGTTTEAGTAGTQGNIYLTVPTSGSPSDPVFSSNTSQDFLDVLVGDVCSGNKPTAGGSRSLAAVYQIETGSGTFSEACTSS